MPRTPGSSDDPPSRRDPPEEAGSLALPHQIGRFVIDALLGAGPLCQVFRGFDPSAEREVAIKLLRAAALPSSVARERLRREGRYLAQLSHHNVLVFYEGRHTRRGERARGRQRYLVTEYIPDGLSLEGWLQGVGTVPSGVALMMACAVARGLGASHEARIIHRDVKPGNVLVDRREPGRLVLCDFGIARHKDAEPLTGHGERLGTPGFMAPEQVRGEPVDERADVHALGAMVYRLVAGGMPFAGGTPEELLAASARGERRALPAANDWGPIDRWVRELVEVSLDPLPENRWQSVSELAKYLEAALALDELGTVESELAAYFADPAGYGRLLPRRVAGKALYRGMVARMGREWALAEERLRRVLELDPGCKPAQGMLEEILRRGLSVVPRPEEAEEDEGEGLEAAEDEAGPETAVESVEPDEAPDEEKERERVTGETTAATELAATLGGPRAPEAAVVAAAATKPRPGRRRWARRVAVALGALAVLAVGWSVGPAWMKRRSGEVPRGAEQALSPEEVARRRILRIRSRDVLRRYGVERLLARQMVEFFGMLAALDGPLDDMQRAGIEDALFDAWQVSTELMLGHLAQHPRTPSAKVCALVLGRIAVKDLQQGAEPDGRIVPQLVAVVSEEYEQGTVHVWLPVEALAAIASVRPLPSIDYLMSQVLEQAAKEGPRADVPTAAAATRALVANGGEMAAAQLWRRMQALPEDAPLRRGIETALLLWREGTALRNSRQPVLPRGPGPLTE